MFSTKPVKSLRNLFAGYHEPLGLSAQQSQKLLDGLKSSFRNQLDQEYGKSSSPQKPPTRPAAAPSDAIQPPNRRSATNQHLRSILSNPLFSYSNTSPMPSIPSIPSPFSTQKRDPMEVFDHAVARGMMTLKAATGCLMAEQKRLAAVNIPVISAASADTALRIVRWLRSSGTENDLLFLDNQQFVRSLVPFLVAEQMDVVAWDWIARIMAQTSKDVPDEVRLRRASFLLAQIVHVKSQPLYGNLDAAISTILQAEQLLKDQPQLTDLLVLPWRSVSWLSTVESYSRGTPSETLFDAHLATANRMSQPFLVEKAHLRLYHPTHPDHMPALEFFQNKKRIRRIVQSVDTDRRNMAGLKDRRRLRWMAYLGHDTVSYLTRAGNPYEAQGLSELLRAELAELFTDNVPEPA